MLASSPCGRRRGLDKYIHGTGRDDLRALSVTLSYAFEGRICRVTQPSLFLSLKHVVLWDKVVLNHGKAIEHTILSCSHLQEEVGHIRAGIAVSAASL